MKRNWDSTAFLCSTLMLIALGVMPGCSSEPPARTFSEEDDVENVDPIVAHDHSHGPHDGHLVVFGNEAYHGEIVFNEESGELTVYIIGPDASTPQPISEAQVAVHLELGLQHVELSLPAVPEAGEAEGMSSRFVLSRDAVPEGIHDAEDLYGVILVNIAGDTYEGEITHDHGDAHDHEHSHDDGEAAHEHSHEDAEATEHEHLHAEEAAESGLGTLPIDELSTPPEMHPEQEVIIRVGFLRGEDGNITDPEPWVFWSEDENVRVLDLLPHLRGEFRQRAERDNESIAEETSIIIRCDADVPYTQIQELIKLGQDAGFHRFILSADSTEVTSN